MSTLALQKRLQKLGLNPGPLDGLWGPSTLAAVNVALDRLPISIPPEPSPGLPKYLRVPADWMPWAQMQRIIVHWTVGWHTASKTDKAHYHILLQGDGTLVRGDKTIADNMSTADGVYAAHVLGLNTGSIGVSLCGMVGAKERPFDAGKAPITTDQWKVLPIVLRDLCIRYSIPVTPQTVLSHAEVEKTLGVKQRGKWDIARLPWDPSMNNAKVIGDQMRKATQALL